MSRTEREHQLRAAALAGKPISQGLITEIIAAAMREAAEEEREACAVFVEAELVLGTVSYVNKQRIAAAIRARGVK